MELQENARLPGQESSTHLKDISLDSQRALLASWLREYGHFDTFMARAAGVMSPASRILEMRKLGWTIKTELITVYDGIVKHPRVARYIYLGEPS